jgi:hypothetical protein
MNGTMDANNDILSPSLIKKFMSSLSYRHFNLIARPPVVIDGLQTAFTLPTNQALEKYYAIGTHTFKCNQSNYILESANAQLWSTSSFTGDSVGKHYILDGDSTGGRATFELQNSIITGTVTSQMETIPADLPLLLLQKTSSTSNGTPIEKTNVIARMNTKYGAAPTSCLGTERLQIPYTAEYWFFSDNKVIQKRQLREVSGTGTGSSVTASYPSSSTTRSASLGIVMGVFIILIFYKM